MVKHCVNPDCSAEFKIVSAGNLYACERGFMDTEFYWLCSTCAERLDLEMDAAGRVRVRPRTELHHIYPVHGEGHLRLVSRSNGPRPWPQSIPSGEREMRFVTGVPAISTNLHAPAATHR